MKGIVDEAEAFDYDSLLALPGKERQEYFRNNPEIKNLFYAEQKKRVDAQLNNYSWMTPEEKAQYEKLAAADNASQGTQSKSFSAEKYLKQLFQKKMDAKKAASMLKVHWAPLNDLQKYLSGQVSPKTELSAYLAKSPEDLGKVRWGTGTVGIVVDGHITIGGRGDLGSDQYKTTNGVRGQQKYASRPGQIDPTFDTIDLSQHHEVLVDNWKIREIVLPSDIPENVDAIIKKAGIPVRRLARVSEGKESMSSILNGITESLVMKGLADESEPMNEVSPELAQRYLDATKKGPESARAKLKSADYYRQQSDIYSKHHDTIKDNPKYNRADKHSGDNVVPLQSKGQRVVGNQLKNQMSLDNMNPNEVLKFMQSQAADVTQAMAGDYDKEAKDALRKHANRKAGAKRAKDIVKKENSVMKGLVDETEAKKGADGKRCWKGKRYAGTENGKDKCIPVKEESDEEALKKSQESDWRKNWEADVDLEQMDKRHKKNAKKTNENSEKIIVQKPGKTTIINRSMEPTPMARAASGALAQHYQSELDDLNRKREARRHGEIDEGVIVGHDAQDPEVAILGGAGTMSLSRLKKKAHQEALQLADDIANGKYSASSYNMRQLHNTLNTIVAAEEEMSKNYFNESPDTSGPVGTQPGGSHRTDLDEATDEHYNIKDLLDRVDNYYNEPGANKSGAVRLINALHNWYRDGTDEVISRRDLARTPNLGKKALEIIDTLYGVERLSPKSPYYYRDTATKLADEFKNAMLKMDYESADQILHSLRTVMTNIKKQTTIEESSTYEKSSIMKGIQGK